MADLSNVPPEVMQIMTHDPPYSEGEKAILQAYAGRPDANPVVVRAFQNLGALPSQISAPAPVASSEMPRDFGIPGLDIPDNIGGIGLPTRDFMEPQSASAGTLYEETPPSSFHADLKHQGADDINFDQMNADPQTGPFGWTLDGLSGLSGLNPVGSGIEQARNPAGVPSSMGVPHTPPSPPPSRDLGIPGLDLPGISDPAAPPTRQSGIAGSGSSTATPLSGSSRASTRGTVGGPTTGVDWRGMRELERNLLPADSVFADIPVQDWNKMSMLMSNPELLSAKLYDTPMAAAGATPQVAAMAQLAKFGLLSEGNQMQEFGDGGNINQLRQIEQTIDSMRGQMGAEVSPRAIYQEAFRRALNTPVEEMSTGDGEPGDISNQIQVTNSYLLLAQPFISQGQQEYFQQKLERYAQAYAQQYVNGETDVSYPQWLSDHGAQNLLGG